MASIGDRFTRSNLRHKTRGPRKALPVHLATFRTEFFRPVGFGKQALESYIKQQRAIRGRKMKITLPKIGD